MQHAWIDVERPGGSHTALDGKKCATLSSWGAPIGDDAFCAAHTVGRVEAAERLLDGIADLEDPQIGLRLLRRAAGHSRLAHNLRCAAPGPQGRALRHFDDLVRTCFETLTGLHPDAAQWEQATRGLGHGGLGLRSTVRDSAAAYLASVGGCSVACTQLDPHYSAIADSHAASALSTYNQVLGTASPLTLETAFSLRQKALTLKLDIASWERQLASSTVAGRAVLLSEAEPGARAFLAALPGGRTRIEPALFTTELGQRLGMTEALQDGWCPQCDSVLDRFSYHAAVCVAGGGTGAASQRSPRPSPLVARRCWPQAREGKTRTPSATPT